MKERKTYLMVLDGLDASEIIKKIRSFIDDFYKHYGSRYNESDYVMKISRDLFARIRYEYGYMLEFEITTNPRMMMDDIHGKICGMDFIVSYEKDMEHDQYSKVIIESKYDHSIGYRGYGMFVDEIPLASNWKDFINERYGLGGNKMVPGIKEVKFNNPATIIFWNDGTKTVVKAGKGEEFDPEKGLVMAIAKKLYGNKGKYYKEIKKWLPKED